MSFMWVFQMLLEMDSEDHLRSDGCVILEIEMLTYVVYAPLSISRKPCPRT